MSKPRIVGRWPNVSAEFQKYLQERGISAQSAKLCQLHSQAPSTLATTMDQPKLADLGVSGGVFPFFDMKGEVIPFRRARLFGPAFKLGRKKKAAKFLQETGQSSHLYLPPVLDGNRTWRTIADDPTEPIVITEGEVKAIACCQHGFACMAVTGVWNFMQRSSGDENEDGEEGSEMLDDFDHFNWEGRLVHVAFDSDAVRNPSVRRAELTLVKALYEMGAKPFIVRLRGERRAVKVGLDDFFAAQPEGYYGRKAFKELMQQAESPLVPKIHSTVEIDKMKFKPQTFVINGILPRGLAMLSSAPKVGKSFLLLQAGHAIATGSEVFGGYTTERSDVLYLALEDTEQRIQLRLQQMGLEPTAALHVATQWPAGDAGYVALERHLEDNPKCRVVLIDTWQRWRRATEVTGKKKSDNLYEVDYAEMAMLKAIADRFGAAILLAHHTKKGAVTDVFEAALGSTALTGAGDTNFVLLRKRHESRGLLHATGRDTVELLLEMEFDPEGSCLWTVIGPAPTHKNEVSAAGQVFLDVLSRAGEPMRLSDIARAVGEARGHECTAPNARQILVRLMTEEKVEQDDKGLYRLVPRS